jgi:hypothetical protein
MPRVRALLESHEPDYTRKRSRGARRRSEMSANSGFPTTSRRAAAPAAARPTVLE